MSRAFSIEVPQRHTEALRFLAMADEDTAKQIQNTLLVAENCTSVSALEAALSNINGISRQNAENLVASLLSLDSLRISHKYSSDDLAAAVSEARQLDLEAPDKKNLSSRLSWALEQVAVREIAKAADLAGERPNTYHTGRILTDIRPLFGDEAKEPLQAAVINQTLRIEYFNQRGELESIFIALSDADIADLMRIANRALVKSSTLREFLVGVNIRAIQVEAD